MIKNIFLAFLILLIILIAPIISFGQSKRCLFIGDSYFSHNSISKEFLAVWNEEFSDTMFVTDHNRNGSTIISQWRYNSDELILILKSQMWDYVIIQLPSLARPQDSSLVQILHKVDALLKNCRILCITMDFCNSFPEMACIKDLTEGVKCNEYMNCIEKLTQVRVVSDFIVGQKYYNPIEIVPFSHYRYYLADEFSIELGSDDEYGHPSPISQSVLARFLFFHITNTPIEATGSKAIKSSSEAIHVCSFYNSYNYGSNK